MYIDTATLKPLGTFDPDNPFDVNDPFAEPTEAPKPTETEEVKLTKVRLSIGSGSRSVDAIGEKGARQAVLFVRQGVSRADGSLTLPTIKEGDKVEVDGKEWTVKGVKAIKDGAKLHHWEVDLV